MPDTVIRGIVERASTPHERLRPGLVPSGQADHGALAEWRRHAAGGDPARFRARLAWDGLSEADALAAVSPVRLQPGHPLPAWAHTLRALLLAVDPASGAHAAALTGVESASARGAGPAGEVPFGPLLAPLADAAGALLDARLAGGALPGPARAALRGALLRTLSRRAAPVLLAAFDARRGGAPGDPSSRTAYDAFARGMAGGGLVRVLEENAVLGRALATAAADWVEAAAEFAARLRDDRAALESAFGTGRASRVARVEAGVSDPHHGGRTALVVHFEGGLGVVYKPRALGVEANFNALLEWLAREGAPVPCRALRVLERGGYGWMELARAAPCRTRAQAREYHRRAGALLCLVYLLGGTDFHLENVVAAGPHPVLVDLEAVMQPLRLPAGGPGEDPPPRECAVQALYAGTALGTGLAPVWQLAPGGAPLEASGLAGGSEHDAPYTAGWRWVHPGTDAMARVRETAPVRRGHNLPRVRGAECRIEEYAGDLLRGFRQTARFVARVRRRLLAPGGPLEAFRPSPVRFLFRPSALYAQLLEHSLRPEVLADGALRSARIDATARAFRAAAGGEPAGWHLQRAERSSLERMDIPLFTVAAGERAFAGVPAPAFAQSALERAQARIRALDARELRRQERLLRTTLALRRPAAPARRRPRAAPPLEPDACLAAALRIGDALERHALSTPHGVVWAAPVPLLPGGPRRLEPAGPGVYAGAGGIALFLAALWRAGGAPGHRSLALDALRGAGHGAADPPAASAPAWGEGWAAETYTLARAAGLLGEPVLLEQAGAVALRGVEQARGSAAPEAVLAALALHAATGDPAALERARRAATRMEATGVLGGAGPALALARLYRATGEPAFREEARAHLAALPAPVCGERRVHLLVRVSARDGAAAEPPGAARRPVRGVLRRDAPGGAETPAVLLELGRRWPNARWVRAAGALAARGVAEGDGGDVFDPTLLHGLAGVGWLLLELAGAAPGWSPFTWE